MRRSVLVSALLFAITAAIYWPVRSHDFIDFDDPQFITDNEVIRQGLTGASIKYAFTEPVVANWHPITTLSHILDCQFFGTQPGAHHLVSAFLHAINAMLLFLALKSMTGKFWRSAIVAALFAWHPLRVESVAWIAERKDVLSGFFFFLTIWAYARYARTTRPRTNANSTEGNEGSEEKPRIDTDKHGLETAKDAKGEKLEAPQKGAKRHENINAENAKGAEIGRDHTPAVRSSKFKVQSSKFLYLLALGLFALGLMSKPMLVTTPFVLLLLDFWPLGRLHLSTINAQPSTGQKLRTTDHGLLTLIIEKLPFFALSAVSSYITYSLQKGAAELNAAVSPEDRVLNAIQSYCRYLAKTFWPTHLTISYPHRVSAYDPSAVWTDGQIALGIIALLGITALCLWKVRDKSYLSVGWFWFLGMLVPVIGLVQVGEQAMADRYTYLPLIGPVIAIVWIISDWVESARTHSVRRSGMFPLRALCAVLTVSVLIAEAAVTGHQLAFWKNTLTLFAHAVEVTPANPPAETSLGVGLEKRGDIADAISHYQRALELNPTYALAHYNLGQVFRKHGRFVEAAAHYAAVLVTKPNDVSARVNYANALQGMGDDTNAIIQFNETLRLDPKSVEALNNLAWLLAANADPALRDGPRAVQLAERACELTHYSQTVLVGTLADAYAEAGRFPDAIATAEKACALASKAGQTELLKRNQELLQLYREGKAFHEMRPTYSP